MGRNEDRLTSERLAPLAAHRESVGIWLPVIGWFVELARWNRVARPIAREIEAVLLARPSFPLAEWSDDELECRIARTLLSSIGESIGWPADRLRPDDAIEIALWDPDDGLTIVEVFLDLEDECGLQVSDGEWNVLVEGTMGEFVARLAHRVRSSGASGP